MPDELSNSLAKRNAEKCSFILFSLVYLYVSSILSLIIIITNVIHLNLEFASLLWIFAYCIDCCYLIKKYHLNYVPVIFKFLQVH